MRILVAADASKVGAAAEAITDAAKKDDCDLLVPGSNGFGTLSNLVLGSVATKVLANCRTPALLIR